MQQLLKLIKQGDRFTPTVYQFGAREHLNIHRSDSYADLTDANSGACIRIIGWEGLRDMGYSPAKLLDGNTTDQFMTVDDRILSQLYSCAKQLLAGLVIAGLIITVGALTGCNNYVLSQLEQDVATSTTAPRLTAASVNQDDLDDNARYLASKQRHDAKHANDFLASVRSEKGGAL